MKMPGQSSNSERAQSLSRARRNSSLLRHETRRFACGFSLIELLIVVAIILIIAAIAIPDLLHAKIAANQAAAVENIRTLTSASIVYSATYGNGFPDSLATLGGPLPASCSGAVLIDEILSAAPHQKSGYTFDYAPQGAALPANGTCPQGYNQFVVTAIPSQLGVTGQLSYCADEPAVIRFDLTGNKATSIANCDTLPPLQ